MNKTVTRCLLTFLILVFASNLAFLMAQSEDQIEAFKKEKEAYYNEKLELTEAEKEDFWCVYNDFHNRKMKFMEEERSAFKYAHKNAENLAEEEINEILGKIRNLKQEQSKLESEYYQNKFPEVLPPTKVLMLYKVEWDFRGHLLRKLRNQNHGKQEKRDGKQGANLGRRQYRDYGNNRGAESGRSLSTSENSDGPPAMPVL